jgi:hypothetical protein
VEAELPVKPKKAAPKKTKKKNFFNK